MKINLIILAVLCLSALGWVYVSKDNAPEKSENHQKILEIAPNFQYEDIKGRTGSLRDKENSKDQITLLHFWATWCAPCIVEFPDIIELASKDTKNIRILAISSDQSKTDITRFIEKLKIDIPNNLILIHDVDKNITEAAYEVKKLPETLLIDQDYNIQKKYIGPQTTWNNEIYKNDIIPLLEK